MAQKSPKVSLEAQSDAVVYHVGDYGYFETSSESQTPYQIRRIKEFIKLPDGNFEVRALCYYRRRDLPQALHALADRSIGNLIPIRSLVIALLDITGFHENNRESIQPLMSYKICYLHLPDSIIATNYQLRQDNNPEMTDETALTEFKHREVFLSRHIESLPTSCIRGKCTVRLLSEVETIDNYLKEPDTFYYTLIFDPQLKTLVPDQANIRIGSDYQAVVPMDTTEVDHTICEDVETLQWTSNNLLTDEEIDQFGLVTKSVGTFARALEQSTSITQPSLHITAAAACRDTTRLFAMKTLHENSYDIAKATSSLVPATGPVYCMDEMEQWSIDEAKRFEEGLHKYGKDFLDLQQEFLPWKPIGCIIEYYYMWKTSDRYLEQKRLKVLTKQHSVKQITITPRESRSENTTANSKKVAIMNGNGPDSRVQDWLNQFQNCINCSITSSTSWHTWNVANSNCKLCSNCWWYWKKFGCFKIIPKEAETNPVNSSDPTTCAGVTSNSTTSTGITTRSTISLETGDCYRRKECGKIYLNQEEHANHQALHRPFECTVADCTKVFKSKHCLNRHLSLTHDMVPPVKKISKASQLRPKVEFSMRSTLATKIARRLYKQLKTIKHMARKPLDAIDITAIQTLYLKIGTIPYQRFVIPQKNRPSIADVVKKLSRVEKNLDTSVGQIAENESDDHALEDNQPGTDRVIDSNPENNRSKAVYSDDEDKGTRTTVNSSKDTTRTSTVERKSPQRPSRSRHTPVVTTPRRNGKYSHLPATVRTMRHIMDQARKTTPRRPKNQQFLVSLEDYHLRATPYLKRLRNNFTRTCLRRCCRKPFKEAKLVLKLQT
ncbi:Metastasis-associated protein MTA1 [Trichoplax sp. H2]|nr:Metastasis-associated protein MTA1 [Trichoplax sp. H2]|eukprot:RDD37744.1 Metastasis-associated protein MTA1 [Trichoplax sp. H2]